MPISQLMNKLKTSKLGRVHLWALSLILPMFASSQVFANESTLRMPSLNVSFNMFGSQVSGETILWSGILVGFLGIIFGMVEFFKIKNLQAHKSMLEISHLIYETCKTYLAQQGKFIAGMWALICRGLRGSSSAVWSKSSSRSSATYAGRSVSSS